jgi:hypothetical protein
MTKPDQVAKMYEELCASLVTIRTAADKLPNTPTIIVETEKYRSILNGCAELVESTLKLARMVAATQGK